MTIYTAAWCYCRMHFSQRDIITLDDKRLVLQRGSIICLYGYLQAVNMENAAFLCISHATSAFTGGIGLSCAANLPLAHIG
jgi:hypothetical protein